MNIISRSFNPELVEWRNVTDPSSIGPKILIEAELDINEVKLKEN